MKPTICPACSESIGYRDKQCRHCDHWIAKPQQATQLVSVQCAHQACRANATIKVKTQTGWANFCPTHYEFHHLEKAFRSCEKRKITTTAQCREEIKRSTVATKKPSRSWAHNLLDKVAGGEDVPLLSQQFARAALRQPEASAIEQDGYFSEF